MVKVMMINKWEIKYYHSKPNFSPKYHTFLLLHGFIKKTQKTPDKELKIALQRSKEYQ